MLYPIPAPQAAPAKHGLVASAFQSPAEAGEPRWELGFTFVPETCAEPCTRIIPCVGSTDSTNTVTPEYRGDWLPDGWTPYILESSFTCTTQQFDTVDFGERARRIFTLGESKLIESELWRGETAGWLRTQTDAGFTEPNLTLAGELPAVPTGGPVNDLSDGSGDPASPAVALRALVQRAAQAPGGPQTMIHATPAVAMAWMQGGGLTEQGGKLYTRVGGHIVVAGTGYGGNGPELAAQDPKVHWAYITTPIYLLRGPVESNYNRSNPAPNVQKQHNDGTAIVRRTVAAYSDGCLHAGIPVDTEGTVI